MLNAFEKKFQAVLQEGSHTGKLYMHNKATNHVQGNNMFLEVSKLILKLIL